MSPVTITSDSRLVPIARTALIDPRLSFTVRGVLAALIAEAPANLGDFAQASVHPQAAQSAFRILAAHGYLIYDRHGGYSLTDTPAGGAR